MDDPEFAAALDTVVRDLRAEGTVLPEVRVEPQFGVYLYGPDGSGHGIQWPPAGTAADRLAKVADQVQEWAVEAQWSAGAPAVWPHCPQHPNSHPLTATVAADAAVWTCPKTGALIARVGELDGGGASGGA